MSVAIQVSGLTKVYAHRPALRGLDLELPWGKLLTVFGPNGSGKSTLIRLLAGLARPTQGRVYLAGLDLGRAAAQARSLVGVVTHQTFLYDDLTGWENLRFYARLFGVQHGDRRIISLARSLALEPYLSARVGTLSHGIQKRLSMARALIHQPTILLLDEPETGLDQEALELLESLLADHRAAGGAAILTTHAIERGLGMADQVAILSEGRLAYHGARDALDTAAFRDTYARVTGLPG